MPTSVLDAIDAAVNSVFSKIPRNNGDNLNGVLEGAVRREQLTCTDFETGTVYQASRMDQAKPAYNSLKNKNSDSPQPSKPEGDDSTLKPPSVELFPLDAVQLGWDNASNDWSVGAGMINMGNTCYLNSTLQALFHVPALANWLVSDKEHIDNCQEPGGLCIICAMRKTLQESQKRNQTTIRPYLIYNKLKIVGRNLVPGRQEDAHEFLRFLVEAMEKSFLNRYKNHSRFDAKVKETTPLNQILGGYLRSAVRCLKCGHVSTTFQHFQDLLLDIRKAQTLDEALEGYFARETLDDDSYHCSSCQKKVPATKQFSLERAPMVLCVQLKRFSVSNNKITKHISFRQRLDLTRYARHRPSVPLVYRLVALVTHMGPSVNCGHYTAVAQTPNGNYYLYDDSMVRSITHQAVFSTNAYIMLYELESSPYALKLITGNNTNSTVTSATASTNTNNMNMNNNNHRFKNLFGSCSSEIKMHQQNNMNGLLNNVRSHNNNNSNNNGPSSKLLTNGPLPKLSANCVNLGYTSDKVYGPQLPPEHSPQKKLLNGLGSLNKTASSSSGSGGMSTTKTMTNGNFSMKSAANTSDSGSSSDSESDVKKDSSSQHKDRGLTETSKTSPARNGLLSSQPAINNGNKSAPCSPHKMQFNVQNKMSLTLPSLSNNSPSSRIANNNHNNNVDNNSRNKLQFSSKSDKHINSQQQTNNNNSNNSATTRLVPYEPDDSSCSEESNSAAEIESRVSTKAALGGDWKVTIGPFSERSSSQAIGWSNTNNNNSNYAIQKKSAPSADNDDTLSQLLKMSHNGYAAPVSTWNGTRSQLDKEVSNERREERKRMLADNNNEDHGFGGGNKAKHQKMNNGSIGYNNSNRSNPGYNPMQEYHNHKIWNHNRPGGHYKTFYNPHNRHRRNFHHHNKFQKNYRFGQ